MSIRKKSYSRYGAVSSFNLGGVNMVSKNTLKPGKFLLYFFGMIVIVLILGFQPTESAQTQATYPPPFEVQGPTTCFIADCFGTKPSGNYCTANDVLIASMTTYEVIKACRYVGDTGEYSFLVATEAGAQSRYDPTIWVSADGGDAETGSCYRDYLNPITTVVSDLDLSGGYGPFINLEPTLADTCGDIQSNAIAYKILGPIEIPCTAGLINNQQLATVIAWDNQSKPGCTSGGCTNNTSKCRKGSIIVEINTAIVDLAITKVASTTPVFPGDTFTFTLTVQNKSLTYKSTGYTIKDLLPAGVSYVSSSPDVCTSEKDTDTGRDQVTCVVTDDLPANTTDTPIVLTVQLSKAYMGPFPITNEACVTGNEPEYDGTFPEPAPYPPSTLGDNCDTDNVITEVDLLTFTAEAKETHILVQWETATEKDNLGFNLYRATSIAGDRIKLNATLIPSSSPGDMLGSSYAYIDIRDIVAETVYYYWLEDIDLEGFATIHGPRSTRTSGLFATNKIYLPSIILSQ